MFFGSVFLLNVEYIKSKLIDDDLDKTSGDGEDVLSDEAATNSRTWEGKKRGDGVNDVLLKLSPFVLWLNTEQTWDGGTENMWTG